MYCSLLWCPFKGNGSQLSFLWMIPRWHWQRKIWSRCVNDTAESASAVSLRLWNLLQKCPRYHWHRGIWSQGIIDTAESELFKWLSQFSRRIRSHSRNGFSRLNQGPCGDCWMKKARGQKSRDTAPLTTGMFEFHSLLLNAPKRKLLTTLRKF
jgi:hypothetical protein